MYKTPVPTKTIAATPNLYMAETLIYQSHLHKQHPHMLSHVNTNYQYIL